jgi:uncharacterized membrane protein YqiK
LPVVVSSPGVPVDAVSEGPVSAAQVPAVQVRIVAVPVPPAALYITAHIQRMSMLQKLCSTFTQPHNFIAARRILSFPASTESASAPQVVFF